MSESDLVQRAINTIRFLSADAVQTARNGHPGLPMGAAAMAYVLWTRHLRFDPSDPTWPDRDRFVLSAGHGSMLLYSLLHLTGFDLPLEQLKRFRQWGSQTPGHPERGLAPGVETTTGPLGQGFTNGVGMAIAAEHLAGMYNRPDHSLVDHRIFAIVSDGDLMEGVTHEAASLAGHLRLGRLTYLYDDNRITIDGSTELAFTEDRAARFRAYGWHVQNVEDGNDLDAVDRALTEATADARPSIIVSRTHIGYGLPTRQDTKEAHGEAPGEEELAGAKRKLGWPLEPWFYIPDDVLAHFRASADRGREAHKTWRERLDRFRKANPEGAKQFERTQAGMFPPNWRDALPSFPADPKGMATRIASGKTLAAVAGILPELIGGSADLTPSNKTDIPGEPPFSVENRAARYIHFGVREHAMGGILSGIALHGGLIPYGGTFLIFSDYMRPAIRLAALMGVGVIYVFTHDSIGLGEDGPTHQPIEHLPALRAIPHLSVIRPADANEAVHAWRLALERRDGPTALALTRQNLPVLDRSRFASAEGVERGAYVLADWYPEGAGRPRDLDVILMASGSEVDIIVRAAEDLVKEGVGVRLVSFPSWDRFLLQSEAYRQSVFPSEVRGRVSIEAASPLGWEAWVGEAGEAIGLHRFGASAPYQDIYRGLDLTPERVVKAAHRSRERAAAIGVRP